MAPGITKAQFEVLKRKATRLKRENPNLSHSAALDQIARQEGFRNWSLLARTLSSRAESIHLEDVGKPHSIAMYGIVRSSEPGVRPKRWEETVPAKYPARHYAKFKWISQYFEVLGRNEAGVRERLATMRRAIEFMDATDLKPSHAWTRIFRKTGGHRIDGFDHTCVWRDNEKRYVITTEPYLGREDAVPNIKEWCDRHEWHFAVARNGLGIWNPCQKDCGADCHGHTHLVVISPEKGGADPDRVIAALL